MNREHLLKDRVLTEEFKKRLYTLIVDRCEDDLKGHAKALYNKIIESIEAEAPEPESTP